MFFKDLSSKVKEKFHRHHSRSRSPSLRDNSLPSLQDVQASTSIPSAISSAPDFLQKPPAATTATSHSRHSLPILTITKPALAQESEVQNPTTRSNLEVALEPSTVSEKEKIAQTPSDTICDRAYDDLKIEDASLVQAYERILSSMLQKNVDTTDEVMPEINIINQHDKEKRRGQMHQLVKDGLDKISQETKMKSLIGTVFQTVNLAQNLVTEAVKDVPQAALPWAAVCLSLEVGLQYSINERYPPTHLLFSF